MNVYGSTGELTPWQDPNGAEFIAQELRGGHFVGLTISWPIAGPATCQTKHMITAWGDNGDNDGLPASPPWRIKVTDSDRDDGGNIQTYTYDDFNNPNPSGPSEGPGWYFDWTPTPAHAFIVSVTTLSPAEDLTGAAVPITPRFVRPETVCYAGAGDLSCDNAVDFGDINSFVLILTNLAVWKQTYPLCSEYNGDIDGDGTVGFADINPFVALLTGAE